MGWHFLVERNKKAEGGKWRENTRSPKNYNDAIFVFFPFQVTVPEDFTLLVPWLWRSEGEYSILYYPLAICRPVIFLYYVTYLTYNRNKRRFNNTILMMFANHKTKQFILSLWMRTRGN